jgi:hypothetical protein
VYYTIPSPLPIINMPEHLRKTKKDNARKNYELNGKYSARHVRISNVQTKQNNVELDKTNKKKIKMKKDKR